VAKKEKIINAKEDALMVILLVFPETATGILIALHIPLDILLLRLCRKLTR
jgi:hypothetical protein